MEVSKAKMSDDNKEAWITIRSEDEFLVLHVISNYNIEWEKKGDSLNIKVI